MNDFGSYNQRLGLNKGFPHKVIAEKLGFDISILSKIDNGERYLQGHMLKPLSILFGLNDKEIQIKFLNQSIDDEFGDEPHFNVAIQCLILKNMLTIVNEIGLVKSPARKSCKF